MRRSPLPYVLVGLASLLSPLQLRALEIGDKAPTFAVQSLSGTETVSLKAYRGKVVYLDFWASWCPPCLKSLPLLEELRKEFPAGEVQFLAINLDTELEKARRFLGKHPIGYPSATDPEGRLPETFEVKTMPTSFLIDRDGVVRYIHRGFRESDIQEIRKQIRKFVETR